MSVTLISPPPSFAFSADQISVKFKSANYFVTPGAKAVNSLTLLQNVPIGTENPITYGTTKVVLKAAVAPDQSGTQFLAGTSDATILLPYLQDNYLLSRDFEITAQGNTVTFISKIKKLGFNFTPVSGSSFNLINTVPAAAQVIQPNYKIYFKLYLENINNDGFNEIYDSRIPLMTDSDVITVPIADKLHAEILKDLRDAFPDIPEQEILVCKKSCRRYYFEYAESYGDIEQVRKLHRSAEFTILHGGLSYIAQFNKTLNAMLCPGLPSDDRFLKQGSNHIHTRTNQPQYLYFFNARAAQVGAKLKVKLFFADDTSTVITRSTVDLSFLRKYGFNVTYDKIVGTGDYPAKTVSSYEIYLESATGERISEVRTYHLNYQYRQFVRYFLSWSSFGTMDTRICYGKGNSEFELFQKSAGKILQMGYDIKQGTSISYDLKIKNSFKVATGWLSKRELLANRDFFLSAFKYRHVGGLLLPIQIDSKTIPEIEDGKNLFSQLFDYSYQFDDHAFTEGDEEDPGVSSGDFFFNYGPIGGNPTGIVEQDPTVPVWVKAITLQDIEKWNHIPAQDAKIITLAGDQLFTYAGDLQRTVDKEFIDLTATEHNFISEPIDRVWEYFNSEQWVRIPNTFNTLSYRLRHDSFIFNGGNSASIRYSVGDLYDQIGVSKLYSAGSQLTLSVTSDFGDTLFPGNMETTLRAVVSYGDQIITATIDAYRFNWYRVSGDPEDDIAWRLREGIGVKQVNIDDSEVNVTAYFYFEID